MQHLSVIMTFICKSIKKYLYSYQWLRTYLRFQTDVWGDRDILYYLILYAYAWHKLLACSASQARQLLSSLGNFVFKDYRHCGLRDILPLMKPIGGFNFLGAKYINPWTYMQIHTAIHTESF